jgi:hypothetical protein
MRIVALIFVLMTIFAPCAQALDDGLYLISDAPTATQATTLNGKKLFLGKPFAEKIDEASLTSIANNNTAYRLKLTQIKTDQRPPFPHMPSLALVLQNKCVGFLGRGALRPTRGSDVVKIFVSWELSDTAFIAATEAFFKVVPQDRHHPDYQFTAKFIVDPDGYPLARPMQITLQITNCGQTPFTIVQPSEAYRKDGVSENPFQFTAFENETQRAVNIGYPQPGYGIDQLIGWSTIKPGKSISIPVSPADLGKFLIFDKSGTYTVHGSYFFQAINPNAPLAPWEGVLWDDLATADFEVKIK